MVVNGEARPRGEVEALFVSALEDAGAPEEERNRALRLLDRPDLPRGRARPREFVPGGWPGDPDTSVDTGVADVHPGLTKERQGRQELADELVSLRRDGIFVLRSMTVVDVLTGELCKLYGWDRKTLEGFLRGAQRTSAKNRMEYLAGACHQLLAAGRDWSAVLHDLETLPDRPLGDLETRPDRPLGDLETRPDRRAQVAWRLGTGGVARSRPDTFPFLVVGANVNASPQPGHAPTST